MGGKKIHLLYDNLRCKKSNRKGEIFKMSLEEKRIDRLYELLYKIEHTDPDTAAALRWAIFELERRLTR